MEKIAGIDLGFTKASIAILEGGRPKVIENTDGARAFPSVVSFSAPSTWLVGRRAKEQMTINPSTTFFAVNRLLGRRYEHAILEAGEMRLPYTIVKSDDGQVRLGVGPATYPLPGLIAGILRELKTMAEAYLGDSVTRAVVSVPASFDEVRRQAIRDAGRMAGLEIVRLISGTMAAALAYGFDKQRDTRIAVCDFGGGNINVAILEVGYGVYTTYSSMGDTRLGGVEFDQKILDYVVDAFTNETGVDLSGDMVALQRIREASEAVKIELSSTQSARVFLPFIAAGTTGTADLSVKLTRAQLEGLVDDLISRAKSLCVAALKDAGAHPSDIGEVVIAGGMTRMPKVRRMLTDLFGRPPHTGLNPEDAAAIGAALSGGILSGDTRDMCTFDGIPLALGIETVGGAFTPLIARNSFMPITRSLVFSTTENNQESASIRVYQGNGMKTADGVFLGQLDLTGIPPARRGVPQIQVTLDVNNYGVVHATAQCGDARQSKRLPDKGDGPEGRSSDISSHN